MSYDNQAWAARCRTNNGTLKAILQALAVYADEDGMCWPSHERLAWATELTDRTIRDGLKKLEAMGFISRQERRRADGTRKTDLIWLQIHAKDLPMQEPPKFQRGIRPPDINRKELPVDATNRKMTAHQPENDDTINRKLLPGNYQKKNYQENLSSLRSESAREESRGNVITLKRKTRLTEEFDLTPQRLAYAVEHGLSEEEAHHEFEKFQHHFIGSGTVKNDWHRTLLKWFLTASEGQHRSRQAAYGRGGPEAPTVFRAAERLITRIQALRGDDGGHEVDLPF